MTHECCTTQPSFQYARAANAAAAVRGGQTPAAVPGRGGSPGGDVRRLSLQPGLRLRRNPPFLRFALNNVGDPFGESIYRENTFAFEPRGGGVLPETSPCPERRTWGYVTAGGTEGNLYGLYLAREIHPDGVVYYSEHTHCSAAKIVRVLGAGAS